MKGRLLSLSVLWRVAAAVSFAVLLGAAYPPVGSSEAAWVALAPLVVLARFTEPRRAFRWGWAAGFLFWLLSISWLLALARTGGPWPLVVLGWVLLSAYCALYTGVFAMLVSAAWGGAGRPYPDGATDRRGRSLGVLCVVPLAWVGQEYLRSTLFSGFAWNALGVSQHRNLAIIQLAEWGGVYAVSAVVAFMNGALALTGLRLAAGFARGRRSRLHVELMAGLLVFSLAWMGGLRALRDRESRPGGTPLRVAAVQPCIPQLKKWPPEFEQEIETEVRNQTELAVMTGPHLVVWPETALAGVVNMDPSAGELPRLLAARGVPILAGLLEAGLVDGRPACYNSSFLVEPDGRMEQRYRKRHLVPFGEYIPFDKTVTALQRMAPLGITCHAGDTSTVFRLESTGVRFASLICFEDTVAALARQSVRHGAAVLVNQTNDAWFDGTAGAEQHMSQCIFRAVENRVPVVRAANSGVTCFISAAGRVTRLENEKGETAFPGFAVAAVSPRLPGAALTFYTRYGDGPFALPCGVASALACVMVLVAGRKGARHPAP